MSIFNRASAADLAAETTRAQKAEAALAAKVSADETTLAGLVKAVAALQAAGTPPPVTTPPVTTPPVTTPPVTTPPATGFPDTTNTGPLAAVLTKISGNYTVAAGQQATNLDISGQVTLGKGATISKSRLRGAGLDSSDFIVLASDGAQLVDCEIGGGVDGSTYTAAIGVDVPPSATVTLTRCNLHHTSDSLRWDGGINMTRSYIHDLVIDQIPGVHSDGLQATNSSNKLPTVIDGCSITGGTNDDVFGQQYAGDVTVKNSLLRADNTRGNQTSYGIAIYTASSATIVNNTFGKGFQVAPIMVASGIKSTISGNVYEDGTPVA